MQRISSISLGIFLCVSVCGVTGQKPKIAPAAQYPAYLSSVTVADLNNDNAPEIIGLDNNTGAVTVLKNLGNGKYGAPTAYAVTGQVNGLAVGDFNGDGFLDVAVAIGAFSAASGQVAVLLGNGDGTLRPPVYHTVPIPAGSIAVGDFNNDNKPDIAVIGNSNNDATNTVAILTNTGSSFTVTSFPAAIFFGPNGYGQDADFIEYLVAGDFNGDGRIDLAYVDACGQCNVQQEVLFILYNTTTGWVAKQPVDSQQGFALGGSGSESVTAVDVDGDGITDFVIPFAGCYTPCVGVSVVYMNKNNTYSNVQSLDVLNSQDGPTPKQVVVGDFNNDGVADIAGFSDGGLDQNLNTICPGVMVWTGTGNRQFSNLNYYVQPNGANTTPLYTAAGFLDRNGTRDLVVPHGTNAEVWLNSTTNPSDPCPYPVSAGVDACSPSGTVAGGSVHFLASARTNTQPLKRMELWVDGSKKLQRFSDRLSANLPVAVGAHTAVFVEVGANGYLLKKSVSFTVSAACTAPGVPGIHVCAPQQSGSYSSPVQFTAAGVGPNGNTSNMELWIDGHKINNYFSNLVNTKVALSVGAHAATFVVRDNTGAVIKSAVINFTVH